MGKNRNISNINTSKSNSNINSNINSNSSNNSSNNNNNSSNVTVFSDDDNDNNNNNNNNNNKDEEKYDKQLDKQQQQQLKLMIHNKSWLDTFCFIIAGKYVNQIGYVIAEDEGDEDVVVYIDKITRTIRISKKVSVPFIDEDNCINCTEMTQKLELENSSTSSQNNLASQTLLNHNTSQKTTNSLAINNNTLNQCPSSSDFYFEQKYRQDVLLRYPNLSYEKITIIIKGLWDIAPVNVKKEYENERCNKLGMAYNKKATTSIIADNDHVVARKGNSIDDQQFFAIMGFTTSLFSKNTNTNTNNNTTKTEPQQQIQENVPSSPMIQRQPPPQQSPSIYTNNNNCDIGQPLPPPVPI